MANPNTIKQSKIANDKPYVSAKIDAGLTSALKSFNTISLSGFTVQNSNTRFRCDVAGRYFVFAQQLISTSGSATPYFRIQKNGSSVTHGYMTTNIPTSDIFASGIVDLAVNDYIELNQVGAIASAWTGDHSNFSIFKI